jgi:hypothetical protein
VLSIESAEGYVARFMGDGVLAYFGYPQALEESAARAITAAFEIRDGCERLGQELSVPLSARCGIASGGAIIGKAIGRGDVREIPVFGDVANLAARLQTAARRGNILVSPETRKQTASRFAFTRSLPLKLNGFPKVRHGWEPEQGGKAYKVPSIGRTARRRLVGRDNERALFEAAWLNACSGRGSTIAITGEAGIGKSRLVHDWIRHAALSDAQCYIVAADPLHVHAPLHLISRVFNALGLTGHEAAVSNDDDCVHTAALAKRVLARLSSKLAILVIDDLHWGDPSSREVLDAIASELTCHPILMVTTSRTTAWQEVEPARLQCIRLTPLTMPQTWELVTRVAGRRLPEQERDEVVKRSGGIPLFAEELARLLLTTPDRAQPRLVPKTLSALLLARLTTLGPAMALAQCAAVLGVESPIAALTALAERRGVNLAEGLQALDREDVAVVSSSSAMLRFRHALYRDAVLETLLTADRKSLYRDAAQLLDASVTKIVPDAMLAEFWREAGEPGLALDALDRAIDDARQQRAWREICQLARTALTVLPTASREQGGVKRELRLQTSLAEALQITVGYSSPAARAAVADGQRLAERAGEMDQSMMSVAAKWMAASSAGNYSYAKALARQTLTLAHLHGGADALAAANMIDMTTRYRMGDLVGAEAAFRSGGGYFDAPAFLNRAGAIPQTFGNAALVAILMGDSAAARQRSAHALVEARRKGTSYDRCFAAYMVAMVEILLGADRKAVALGTCALRLAAALGFPQFEAIARIVIGRGRAGLGDVEAGMALLREGIAAMAGTHSRNAQTLYLTWLAEAALSGGDNRAAFEATDAALLVNPEELFYRPETLRIRSLALLGQDSAADAETALLEGEAIAVAMKAPWFTDRMKPLKVRLGLI